MPKFGNRGPVIVTIGPLNATTVAVDQDHYVHPRSLGQYKVAEVSWTQDAPSTSGTVALRAITDDSAAGASASSTVVELITALGTDGTDDTVRYATLSGAKVKPGARIASKVGGTSTNLVGLCITMVLVPDINL